VTTPEPWFKSTRQVAQDIGLEVALSYCITQDYRRPAEETTRQKEYIY